METKLIYTNEQQYKDEERKLHRFCDNMTRLNLAVREIGMIHLVTPEFVLACRNINDKNWLFSKLIEYSKKEFKLKSLQDEAEKQVYSDYYKVEPYLRKVWDINFLPEIRKNEISINPETLKVSLNTSVFNRVRGNCDNPLTDEAAKFYKGVQECIKVINKNIDKEHVNRIAEWQTTYDLLKYFAPDLHEPDIKKVANFFNIW